MPFCNINGHKKNCRKMFNILWQIRESSSLLNKIKKGKQQDHPDNGLKSIRFTGPGQDFGNAATAASKVYIMIS